MVKIRENEWTRQEKLCETYLQYFVNIRRFDVLVRASQELLLPPVTDERLLERSGLDLWQKAPPMSAWWLKC